jgi:hypothetical protein
MNPQETHKPDTDSVNPSVPSNNTTQPPTLNVPHGVDGDQAQSEINSQTTTISTPNTAQNTYAQKTESNNSTELPRRSRKNIYILIAAIIFIVAFAILFILGNGLLRKNNSSDASKIKDLKTLFSAVQKYGNDHSTLPSDLSQLNVNLNSSISDYKYTPEKVDPNDGSYISTGGDYANNAGSKFYGFDICTNFNQAGLQPSTFGNSDSATSVFNYHDKGYQCFNLEFPRYSVTEAGITPVVNDIEQKVSNDSSGVQDNSQQAKSNNIFSSKGDLEPTDVGKTQCTASLSNAGNYAQVALSGGSTCGDVNTILNSTAISNGSSFIANNYKCTLIKNGTGLKYATDWQSYWHGTFYSYTCSNGSKQIAFNLK